MKRCFGAPDREWLHPRQFLDEPVYSEAPHDPDDVIYPGSDDEAYSSPTERRSRCEAQAQRFLDGKPVFLLSAALRGPFDSKSGWINPWRSKSTSRVTKPRQRNRRSSSKSAAEQHESSRVVEAVNRDPRLTGGSAAPRRNACAAAQYMDNEKFLLVQAWREKVLAETDVSTSPAGRELQSEPASADSRRATQQTTRRESDLTLDTSEDRPRGTAPYTPSAANKVETRVSSATSKRKRCQMSSNSADDARSPLYSNRAAIGQYCPSSSAPAPEARITTPGEALLETKASALALKTQASARTDGSFRFRRKDARDKGSTLGKSRLAGSQSMPSDPAELVGVESQPVEGRLPGETKIPEHTGMRKSPGCTTALPKPIQQLNEAAPNSEVQETTEEDAPEPGGSQSIEGLDEQASDHGQYEKADGTETASQIDGPTLVPSQSPRSSEDPSMPSFGHFSCEKQSQDVISDAVGFPRKLLWPRPQQSASGDGLPLFGIESTPIVSPKQPEPVDFYPGHPILSDLATCTKQTGCQPVEEPEAVQALPEGNVETPIQEHRSAFAEPDEVPAKPSPARASVVEDAREAEGDDVHETGQVQVWVKIEPGIEDDMERGLQPTTSRPPEVQSPWVKDDAALFARQASNAHSQWQWPNQNVESAHIRSSSPKATQSPWNKDVDFMAAAITGRSPSLLISNERLSVIANQALEEPASQSPWAKDDSQLQIPGAQLFNPVSLPAPSHDLPVEEDVISGHGLQIVEDIIPSHGLPIAHAGVQSPAPGDENIDMCDPSCPSTPETKRSSIPTPDVTLSVKSFKEFMTPSPRPAAKRRRISTTTTYGHLPSTQALVDATVSNPWLKPASTKAHKQKKHKRTPKRVSWAALPDEEEPSTPCPDIDTTTSSPYGAAPSSDSIRRRKDLPATLRSRAASPPPSSLSASKLPAANQKFGKHFAAVASRRIGTTPLRQTANVRRLLPSASQQVCESPAVDAMAEAFIRAEKGAVDLSQGEVVEDDSSAVELMCEGAAGMNVDQPDEGSEEGGEDEDEDKENAQEEETQEAEQPVDDVSAVLQNLDDFLGSWNLDADLAKARAESERENKRADRNAVGLSGLMDAGVWY
ncbi:uncharacterized protein B0T15DRAFT_535218 [Chaetomium strumarium]|uniref:Protamine P1 n=1 Tax=Chaetomium strumarium TaxID=1170767 RepID=A0AAJ0GPZ0_9PEZI|nr:hypothetical protein B0T15DRAFT_535218 [Chaetomium strumarium]